MRYAYSDGGRAAAGFKGRSGDCVVRAIAIASQLPYAEVHACLREGMGSQRKTKREPKPTIATGVNVRRKWFKDYMRALGWDWVPTMSIGSGCTVHLHDGELHPSDARVEIREVAGKPCVTHLTDEEGFALFTFHGDWTSEQIEQALEFANRSYSQGHQAGQRAKAREMQRVLTCD